MWRLHFGEGQTPRSEQKAVANSKNLGESLFFNISSVIDDSSDYVWSFFLKEKFNLMDVMLSFITNLKNKYNLQLQYLCYENMG